MLGLHPRPHGMGGGYYSISPTSSNEIQHADDVRVYCNDGLPELVFRVRLHHRLMSYPLNPEAAVQLHRELGAMLRAYGFINGDQP